MESQEFDFSSTRRKKSKPPSQKEPKITVKGVASLPRSDSKCFVCSIPYVRSRTPSNIIDQMWIKHRILVPSNNRCCPWHYQESGFFDEKCMAEIRKKIRNEAVLTSAEFSLWLNRLGSIAGSNRIDFEDPLLTEEDYSLITGLSKSNFSTMHTFVKKNLRDSKNRSTRNALAIFMAKIRLGVSNRFLGFLFGMSDRRVSDTITAVSKVLEDHFVPNHLGYNHLTRDEIKTNHTPSLSNALYRVADDSIVLILDGTYIYIQKPKDHQDQLDTFSMQKH